MYKCARIPSRLLACAALCLMLTGCVVAPAHRAPGPGYWVPRAGYVWVPHTWVRAGGGWYLREGYWRRAYR